MVFSWFKCDLLLCEQRAQLNFFDVAKEVYCNFRLSDLKDDRFDFDGLKVRDFAHIVHLVISFYVVGKMEDVETRRKVVCRRTVGAAVDGEDGQRDVEVL